MVTVNRLLPKALCLVLGIMLPVVATGGAFAQQSPTAEAPVEASPIEGTWVTALQSEITILPCPEGYCGFITKVVVPEHILQANQGVAEMAVEEFLDYKNKDPALQGRQIMGLQILTMRPAQKPLVYDGEIYNPEDGNIYGGYLEIVDSDTVRLNGCVLFNLLCRGEEWVRAVPEVDAVPEAEPASAD
jgi:uncharacterized protein (DUF2147 family)